MTHQTIEYRPADKSDTREIAILMNIAGEGIPLELWSGAGREAGDPITFGANKAAREDGNFSYRNAQVAAVDGGIAGMVLAYPLATPSSQDIEELNNLPALVRPMVELEYEVGGSFYINALAVHDKYRGRGIGTRLLDRLTRSARDAGCTVMSVGVFSENTGAFRLYQREGFRVVGERPVTAHRCYSRTDRTLMLTKQI